MRPLTLTLEGITSFKDKVRLDFEKLDLFVISGATGAGKSSLLDAMTYALFGKVPRTNKHGLRELISHGRDRMAVVLDFQVGVQSYRVARSRKRKGATQVQLEKLTAAGPVPVADKVETVGPEVARLLGLGFDAFTQAVVLPQGQFAAFLKSEACDRREMLNGLLGLSVYKRMHGLAGIRESAHESRKTALERRLREDFEGVTAGAVSQLRARQQELRDEAEESRRHLAEAQQRLAAVRRVHDLTRELSAREQELSALRQREPTVEAMGRQVEAARRASVVVPLLDRAERAQREQLRRAGELAGARKEQDALLRRHRLAQDALAAARRSSAELPGLREREGKLAEVLGKLPHRDQLDHQCAAQRDALQQMRVRRERRRARREELSREMASLADRLGRAGDEVASVGYDPELDRRITGARDGANQLRAERGRMEREAERSRRAEREAEEAEVAAADADVRKKRAVRQLQRADRHLAAARAALADGHQTHAAAHLRGGLVAGLPCPVCRQEVDRLPGTEPVPLLERLDAAVGQAEQAARAAAAEATTRAAEDAAARATALGAGRQAAEARSTFGSTAAAVGELEEQLQAAVGPSVAGFPGQMIEARTLAAVEAVSVQRQKHEKIRGAMAALDLELRLRRQEGEAAGKEVEQFGRAVADGEEQLRQLEAALDRLREEIRAVTEADDPREERKGIAARITQLEQALRQSAEAEAEAARQLEGARGKVEQLQRVAAEADGDAEAASAQADDAVRQARFPDAAAARAAALAPERIEAIQAQLDGHRQALHAAQARIAELVGGLDGRRASDRDLLQAEQEHTGCQERHEAAQKERATVAEKLRTLEDKLTRAGELQRELVEIRGQHRVYRRLAGDLQSDCFQAYLLEEALGELVRGASRQLGRLTGDRYGLDYVNDQIVVIDRDNAGERRITDTLSGGETFLASLSLALELSAQVQRAVGAVHLDCLFIDEGFGTLDPETLRVVADAVRGLQVGGRMVGIITHVPELREEFDQRLLVEKESGSSRVRIETA